MTQPAGFVICVELNNHCWFNLGYRKLYFCSKMGIIVKEKKSSLKVLTIYFQAYQGMF